MENITYIKNDQGISDYQLDKIAVLNRDHASSNTSDRYSFVSSRSIINALKENNWLPVEYKQSKTKKPEYEGYQKHMVTLRQPSTEYLGRVGDTIPQLVLYNSHNATSPIKLLLALFRLVCSNGMMTSEKAFEYSMRHTGIDQNELFQSIHSMQAQSARISDQLTRFQTIELTPNDRGVYVNRVIDELTPQLAEKTEHKSNSDEYRNFIAKSLASPIRGADVGSSLWLTHNVVQEKLIRGNVRYYDARGRLRRTRGVSSIDRELQLNRKLWDITADTANQLQ